jgi:hypothetical protein
MALQQKLGIDMAPEQFKREIDGMLVKLMSSDVEAR